MTNDLNSALDSFQHSYKGTTWNNHKYVRKENGRYIYPKDSGPSRNPSNRVKRDKIKRLKGDDQTSSRMEKDSVEFTKKIGKITEEAYNAGRRALEKTKNAKISGSGSKNFSNVINSIGSAFGNILNAGIKTIVNQWEDQETSFVLDFFKAIRPK